MSDRPSLLTRTFRLVVNPGHGARSGTNGYAGTPVPRGLTRYYEFQVRCIGTVDPVTGYLVDIKAVDAAMQRTVAPLVDRACGEDADQDPALLLPALVSALAQAVPARLQSLCWRLTPYYALEVQTDHPTIALMRQRFDFAASHRLNVATLSESENRALFGKCNNAAGHGHNYQVEPCIAVDLSLAASDRVSLSDLESLTEAAIIRRFDHKHLNIDTPEFAESGVNPSVENIAAVFFRLLDDAIRAHPRRAELRSITVWETDRTSSTYPA